MWATSCKKWDMHFCNSKLRGHQSKSAVDYTDTQIIENLILLKYSFSIIKLIICQKNIAYNTYTRHKVVKH